MEKLPQDVKFDIFSRLPAESILLYKQVSKSWLSLLNHPSFAQIHLRRQLFMSQRCDDDTPNGSSTTTTVPSGGGVELGFILRAGLDDSDGTHLFYRKYDENDEQSYKIVKRINHPFTTTSTILNGLTMISSCNGLICLSATSGIVTSDPAYIFNPITREYVHLPRLFGDAKSYPKGCNLISGFGYHPSTDEYKVVRIFYADCRQKFGQVQVYTLGAGSGWRDLGKVPFTFMSMHGYRATLANGKLHWLNMFDNIVAFDLAEEEFYCIPSPPVVLLDGQEDKYGQYSRQLCVLGGRLGLAHNVVSEMGWGDAHVDIWLLNMKSTTGYDMNEQEDECGGWSKEFSIPTGDIISLLSLTKRGEVLFWSDEHYLCLYDPKSAAIKKLDQCDGKKYSGYPFSIPHVNSFVSLKALGESVGVE